MPNMRAYNTAIIYDPVRLLLVRVRPLLLVALQAARRTLACHSKFIRSID